MNEMIKLQEASAIMGQNFIGVSEIASMEKPFLQIPTKVPTIPFTIESLYEKKDDYFLILGVSKLSDGSETTIRNMRNIFGKDPVVMEPCFYNQDWYDKEEFIDISMKDEWVLIRKNVFENSRAVQPDALIQKYSFPSAIKCTYAFFVTWLSKGIKLWYHDFIWCSDVDHNGDRIYIGKYHDIDGVNKNGFSIHRHLALRQCYGCID